MPYTDIHLPGHIATFLVSLPSRPRTPAVAQPGPPVAGASPLVGDEGEGT